MNQGKLGPRNGIDFRRRAWVLAALATVACSRELDVSEQTKDTPDASPLTDTIGASSSDAPGKTNLLDGIDQDKVDAAAATNDAASSAAKDATAQPTGDTAPLVDTRSALPDAEPAPADASSSSIADATTNRDAAPPGDASPLPDTRPDTAVPADTSNAVLITGLQVLADGLSSIDVPAVGSDRVSVLQYTAAGTAMALHVTWDGVKGGWYESSAARYIYLAASGTRHVGLLYLASSYPVQQNGASAELSTTPATYKEFLAANDTGYAWVDYVQGGGGSGDGGRQGGGGGGATTTGLGAVVFQTWQGTRTSLTDALRYRARVDVSNSHVAYVEYAATTAGTPGQIMVQPIAGGAASVVAASNHHQDRPAVDGNWVVWEEYLSSTDAVIRARNLVTGDVRNLSAATGFRTNPDIRGTRVVWEDQRAGNGDIYTCDLAANNGEQIAVSGTGHSTAARLTADGLVWMEVNGNNIGLLRARWK